MNLTSTWLYLALIICCTFRVTNARDYCKEHEDKHNGTGYCLNGGECINKAYGKDCICMSGFRGDQCADEIDECSLNSNLCFNGASCINKWGSYECLCTHGFEGKHCEINRDDCAEHACPDSKICVDEVDSYSCICPHGRYGENCEFEDICVTNNPCAYGNCSMTSENDYYCDCENGYTGKNCDLDVNECEDESGEWCLNGKCQNLFGSYKCHCEMGFQGRNCRDLIPHCEGNPCQNGGTCLNNYAGHTCLCMPGFTGDNCEIRLDKSCNKDCQNGGVCYQQSHCMCPSAYKGELCEIERPNPCKHDFCGEHGYCSPTENYSSYYCTCENGYRGENCEFRECASQGECIMSVDFCSIENINCSGHGRCLNMKNSYRCACDDGYEGQTCAFSEFTEESDTNLRGNVIFIVTGSKETVIRHLRDIIFQIGRLTYISARIVLTKDGYPKIYEFDPERGIQDLVDTTSVIHPDNKDIVFGKKINPNPPPKMTNNTSAAKYKGFMITFRLDISTCLKERVLKPEIECPEDVEHIAARLLGPMSKVLEPLGIHLEKVEGSNGQDKTPVGHYILYAGFVIVSVLLIISILTTARKKLHYRDRNLCTAAIWTPPKNTNTKGFPGSMTSLTTFTQSHFGGYPQNMSTLTSLGASSMTGSFVSASREQLNKLDHDPASLSPLHHIIKMVDDQKVIEEVEKQLNHGADPNATDSMGRTPLMFAVNRRGDVGIRLIELLISRGADLKRVDRDGLNVLHIAIESTDAFNELIALHLIRNHSEVNVDAAARSEETPLKICARVGDLTEMVVRALLATGQVDVDSIGDEEYPESRRRTALHVATETGSIKIMELLLRSGAKVDAKDINEQTALHLAAENMRVDATKMLINYGADKNIVDADNRTPENVARFAYWQDGPRILNEPPSQPVEKKPADTSTKPTRKNKRAASSNTKAAKKSKIKPTTTGSANEALLPTPSTMLSPSSDSSSSPNNGQSQNSMNGQYNYPSYVNLPSQNVPYIQPSAYYPQQTPELMNSSICSSSDSQTHSPPMHPSGTSSNNSTHFNYNFNGMNSYSQNGYCYTTGTYPEMNTNWYSPANYYVSSKVPSYSNGTNTLEFSPNSDQSMHNYGSPPDAHPNVLPSQTANDAIYYHQNPHPTIV